MAERMMETQKQNEERFLTKLRWQKDRIDAIEEQKLINKTMRETNHKVKMDQSMGVLQQKQQMYKKGKLISKISNRIKQIYMEEIVRVNNEKAQERRCNYVNSKQEFMNNQERNRAEQSKRTYFNRLSLEQMLIDKSSKEIKELEQLESQIVERVKNTQN